MAVDVKHPVPQMKFKNPFPAHETNTMQGLWAKNEPIRPSGLGYRGEGGTGTNFCVCAPGILLTSVYEIIQKQKREKYTLQRERKKFTLETKATPRGAH